MTLSGLFIFSNFVRMKLFDRFHGFHMAVGDSRTRQRYLSL